MVSSKFAAIVTAASALTPFVSAFDADSKSNLAIYWGQGAYQNRLSYFCQDRSLDIINVGFITSFPDESLLDWPTSNYGNQCNGSTYLVDDVSTGLQSGCNQIIEDIPICQAAGKKIMLSLGGQDSITQILTYQSATYFADWLWGSYGPVTEAWVASGGPRPFGDVVVDGFDFDIENGGDFGYATIINRLRQHFADYPDQTWYISGAPQCPIPDANLNDAIINSAFDFIWVQFYNNPSCNAYNALGEENPGFNYDSWVNLIQNSTSASKDAKLFVGLPASEDAANNGYLTPEEAQPLISTYMDAYPEIFGGVMLWEATYSNNNTINGSPYADVIKDILDECNPTPKTTPTPTASSTSVTASSTAVSSSSTPVASPSSTPSSSTPAVSPSATPSGASSSSTSSSTPIVSPSSTPLSSSSAISSSTPAASSPAGSSSIAVVPSASSTVTILVTPTPLGSSSSASSSSTPVVAPASSASSSASSSSTPIIAPASSASSSASSSSTPVIAPASSASSSASSSSIPVIAPASSASSSASSSSIPVIAPASSASFSASSSSIPVIAPASSASSSIIVTPSASSTVTILVTPTPLGTSTGSSSLVSSSSVSGSSSASIIPGTSSSIPAQGSSPVGQSSSGVSSSSTQSATASSSSSSSSSSSANAGASSTGGSGSASTTSAPLIASITSAPAASSSAVVTGASSEPLTITTVIITSYVDICPTGFTTITRTITTTYCPGNAAAPTATLTGSGSQTATPAVPEGWTTKVTVCSNCAATPTTVTLTLPVTETITGAESNPTSLTGANPANPSGVSPTGGAVSEEQVPPPVQSTSTSTSTVVVTIVNPTSSRPLIRPSSTMYVKPSSTPSGTPSGSESRVPVSPSSTLEAVAPVFTGAAPRVAGLGQTVALLVVLALSAFVMM